MAEHDTALDKMNEELAAKTGRRAPQYNLIASTASGEILGAITLAHGLYGTVDEACNAVQQFFKNNSAVGLRAVNVRPLSKEEGLASVEAVRGKLNEQVRPKTEMPKPDVDLGQILMDVKNATDCCVFSVAVYCRNQAEIRPDAEVRCVECGSHFRYANDGEGNYAWIWVLPKQYVNTQREIFPLEEAFQAANERHAVRVREEKLSRQYTETLTKDTPKVNATFAPPKPVRIYVGSESGDGMPKMSSRVRETLD